MKGKLKFKKVATSNWEVFDDDGYVITISETLKNHIVALQDQVEELREALEVIYNSLGGGDVITVMPHHQEQIKQALKKEK